MNVFEHVNSVFYYFLCLVEDVLCFHTFNEQKDSSLLMQQMFDTWEQRQKKKQVGGKEQAEE